MCAEIIYVQIVQRLYRYYNFYVIIVKIIDDNFRFFKTVCLVGIEVRLNWVVLLFLFCAHLSE